MYRPPKVAITLCVVAAVAIIGILAFGRATKNALNNAPPSSRMDRFPSLILWAWERPESLNHIDTSQVAVAFLSKTIYLRDDRVVIRPRLQTLTVSENSSLIAVARVESDALEPPTMSTLQVKETSREIAELARLPRVTAVQVDFDAKSSEREFYRQLIFDLRKQLPEQTALSITALASWCRGDNWLEDLPIDEAVPMLFRMGIDRHQILSQLNSQTTFRSKKCRSSVGISTDEPITDLPATRRVYVFNPNSWSHEAVQTQLRNRNE